MCLLTFRWNAFTTNWSCNEEPMENRTLPPAFRLAPHVARALSLKMPVVALESTVITHGLPSPDNLSLAHDMETAVQNAGATPATVGVLGGKVIVGLNDAELAALARAASPRKISVRDFGAAIAQKATGGTTVAGTLLAARLTGIRVFATGGIGGVHRWPPHDVSADLPALAQSPVIVVCAGAKAILDLPATLEMLETLAVPVVGYQTDEFPAFYSRESGLKAPARADTPQEVAKIAQAHWALGLQSAVLVVVPPPAEAALPRESVDAAIAQALQEAEAQGIRGQASTPFLLERVSELTGRASLQANLALLKNNAVVAAQIARALFPAPTAYMV